MVGIWYEMCLAKEKTAKNWNIYSIYAFEILDSVKKLKLMQYLNI